MENLYAAMHTTREFGHALRQARHREGITQGQLAARLGVTKSYVSKLETGNLAPSLRTFKQLEKRLGNAWPGAFNQTLPSLPAKPLHLNEDHETYVGANQLVFDLQGTDDWIERLLPVQTEVESGPPPVFHWDIPQTIGELSYLTHNFFRYYGKFPPTIPRRLLRDFRPPQGTWVLDNFSGSGTTLVEAKCERVPSVGVDVSPLATLATRVKTTHVDLDMLRDRFDEVMKTLLGTADGEAFNSTLSPPQKELDKWFDPKAATQLLRLKRAIMGLSAGPEQDFLTCAFFAIIRRVSVAYDGEVRPHVNPGKRQRDVLTAFKKKVADMMVRMARFQKESSSEIPALALTGDNRNLADVANWEGRPVGLVISHPPYLNCFDYFPVYRLEYLWAAGFREPYLESGYRELRSTETRCWPATEERIFDGYFDGLAKAFAGIADLTERGTRCCVVLGDCSIRGEVVPVLDRFSDIMEGLGFGIDRLLMRSTHYGIGKYAYAHRADYHGELAKKRDGILVFKRR